MNSIRTSKTHLPSFPNTKAWPWGGQKISNSVPPQFANKEVRFSRFQFFLNLGSSCTPVSGKALMFGGHANVEKGTYLVTLMADPSFCDGTETDSGKRRLLLR